MDKIATAIVGAGKMGRIHTKVCSQLPESELVAVVDVDKDRAEKLANKHSCGAYTDSRDILDKVDAATIATPTEFHLDQARLFIEKGIPVMIEKPLASNTHQGRQIVELAKKHNVTVAVGHSERCNPVVRAMKRLEIEPKFIECNRVSPYPFRSTDIGVVLDVMIHDIDIVLSMAESTIKNIQAIGVNVIEENEDICNARITFENGCVADITASRLALRTERKVRVFSRQAYLSMDYFKKSGIVIKADPNSGVIDWIKQKKQEGGFDFTSVNWPDLLHIEELEIDDKEPLRIEQESFLRACAGNGRPEVTAEEGLAAIDCAQRVLEAIKEHSWD